MSYRLLVRIIALIVNCLTLQIYLLRKEEIPREKIWYLFLCGLCLFIEAILTIVVLYHN